MKVHVKDEHGSLFIESVNYSKKVFCYCSTDADEGKFFFSSFKKFALLIGVTHWCFTLIRFKFGFSTLTSDIVMSKNVTSCDV